MVVRYAPSLAEQFWRQVDRSGPCWTWTGKLDDAGYGLGGVPRACGRRWRAHQLAYLLTHGPIPDGLTIDHICGTRSCVRPQHLQAVSLAENVGFRRDDTTHCVHGHRYTPENTTIWSGKKFCRTCMRIRGKRMRQERADAGITAEGPLGAPVCPGSGSAAERAGRRRVPCPSCGTKRLVASGQLAEHTAHSIVGDLSEEG